MLESAYAEESKEATVTPEVGTREDQLFLPCEDAAEWSRIEQVLRRPLQSLAGLDAVLTEFHATTTKQKCKFFATIPGTPEAGRFDFDAFWGHGVPFMLEVALAMPVLFANTQLPLLLRGRDQSVSLSRRQCACLLAHSFFGSITASARRLRKEKWAFRASQLFFLEAVPSALCFLNYFKVLGLHKRVPKGVVVFSRNGFPRRSPPWAWESEQAPLCKVQLDSEGSIEDSCATRHADFANKFVGGGCLENDFNMEEILFVAKPELIVSMALSSYMVDEDVIQVQGALQFSCYKGYGHTFEFNGDYDARRKGDPPTVVAMDALQGCKKIQFGRGLVLRDLNKARLAFDSAKGEAVATGNWGCGAFGNDHVLKFLQQWLAASSAGAALMHYHTRGDKRTAALPFLVNRLKALKVCQLWHAVLEAAEQCAPGPKMQHKFHELIEEFAKSQASKSQADTPIPMPRDSSFLATSNAPFLEGGSNSERSSGFDENKTPPFYAAHTRHEVLKVRECLGRPLVEVGLVDLVCEYSNHCTPHINQKNLLNLIMELAAAAPAPMDLQTLTPQLLEIVPNLTSILGAQGYGKTPVRKFLEHQYRVWRTHGKYHIRSDRALQRTVIFRDLPWGKKAMKHSGFLNVMVQVAGEKPKRFYLAPHLNFAVVEFDLVETARRVVHGGPIKMPSNRATSKKGGGKLCKPILAMTSNGDLARVPTPGSVASYRRKGRRKIKTRRSGK